MTTSLLEKAKTTPSRDTAKIGHKVNKQTIDLALALLKEEVTYKQAAQALGFKSTGYVGAWMVKHLKAAMREGRLKIEPDTL